MNGKEIRCPRCGRLLALKRGREIEIKTSRQVIVTQRADLSCLKCGGKVSAGICGESEKGEG